MLPDDLFCGVTLQAAGSRIPSRDTAARIQAVDRVIDDGVDEVVEALFGEAKLFFGGSPGGKIARDFAKPSQTTNLVAKRGDDDVGPEARTVFTKPPPFIFDPSDFAGGLELTDRLAGGDVFGAIKPGEMLADDLARCVSVDLLCTRVPRGDPSFVIQHEDRVVGDTVDE
jgi:hypothetical protein